jgi:hypothetical protein
MANAVPWKKKRHPMEKIFLPPGITTGVWK